MTMKRTAAIFLVTFLAVAALSHFLKKKAAVEAAGVQAPMFEVDPLWPKPLPNHWIQGMTVGVAVDGQDHIWIVHRTNTPEQKEIYLTWNPPAAQCCAPAPPVLEFDQQGNLINHWGGPGNGYDWPVSNHGIFIDYKGNVWIGGNGNGSGGSNPAATKTPEGETVVGAYHDSMVLKFTQDGKFLMQIGKPGQSKGSNDLDNLRGPAKMFVDPLKNELYVGDGYGNKRVIVFDADTGKYKRHWGAYGHKPDDTDPGNYDPDAPPDQQFRSPVHCAQLSHDGLLYVCDRVNDRIQVFKPDGTFVKEVFINKRTRGDGSVWDIDFSRDPEQKYIYLADGANDQIHILLRDTLKSSRASAMVDASLANFMRFTALRQTPKEISIRRRPIAASASRSSSTKDWARSRKPTRASCGLKTPRNSAAQMVDATLWPL